MTVHPARVSPSQKSDRLLARAERQFKKLLKTAGMEAVPLTELLDLVNEVSEQLLPEKEGRDSRVSRVFTPRSFRHYQTLGCIDAPERSGKQVLYRLRHFLQALLVRKLLWERVSSDRIVELMKGLSTEEIRQMLVDRSEALGAADSVAASGAAETWNRVVVAPGVELHMSADLPKPKPGEVERLLEKVESVLRTWVD